MNRWGKLKEEKKKKDMARAPWTKKGTREPTIRETEEEGDRTVTCEEDEGWEPCGSNDVPKKKHESCQDTTKETEGTGDSSAKEYDDLKKKPWIGWWN